MLKERLKDSLLISMLCLSLFLTSELFLTESLATSSDMQNQSVAEESDVDIELYYSPQSYLISFGGGLHTRVYSTTLKDDIWVKSKKVLRGYLNEYSMEAMDLSKYEQAVKGRSIKLNLYYPIQLGNLKTILDVDNIDEQMDALTFDEILIPVSQMTGLYLANSEQRMYYYIPSELNHSEMTNLVNFIESNVTTDYGTIAAEFLLDDVFKGQKDYVSNLNLIPKVTPNVTKLRVIKEFETNPDVVDGGITTSPVTYNETELKAIAKKVFGRSFDFIKKIQDIDHSVIYMYGYNERALKLGHDGSVEYQEKFDATLYNETKDFKDGLQQSVDFLMQLGKKPATLSLVYYDEEKEGRYLKRHYYFNYSFEEYGLDVITPGAMYGESVHVEIIGGQLTYFKKNLKTYFKELPSSGRYEVKSLNNIIGNELHLIGGNYQVDTGIETIDDVDLAYEVLNNIKDVEVCYVLSQEKIVGNTYLENVNPCWKIEVGKRQYYYDMYSGELRDMKVFN